MDIDSTDQRLVAEKLLGDVRDALKEFDPKALDCPEIRKIHAQIGAMLIPLER